MRCGPSPTRWMALLAAVVLSLAACDQPQSSTAPCVCDEPTAAPPVDATLMAYLSKARSLHHQADLKEQEGDRAGAIMLLEQLVGTPLPGSAQPLPEVKEVLAETRARMADLRSQLGDYVGAQRDVQEGLRLAPPASYFEGHLMEILGIVHERHAHTLTDKEAAGAVLRAAVEAFERAVKIQDQVIDEALSSDGGHTNP